MPADPFDLFQRWLGEARTSEPNDAEAMALATVGRDGRPSVRMVLLKGHSQAGFTFYTNLESRKAEEIAADPQVALLFHWKSLRRQVRVEGVAQPVGDSEADAYFASRGRDSQLGAWASDQSRPLESREIFEQRLEVARQRFDGAPVPRPPGWSGYTVVPHRIEFWSDRPHRLHERRLFTRAGSRWSEGLLYP